ncbi:MAG: hypothetical protein K9N07_03420 [Candidatus Cloacimonetes bacterium]|nr:hypothetical protein [Candidatus Cloacimonadota bacterium]
MVNPIYIIILSLITGFLLSIFDKIGRKLSMTIFYGVLSFNLFVMAIWFYRLLVVDVTPLLINTAGFVAPISINLRMGLQEAFILLFSNFIALFAAIYLFKKFKKAKISSLVLYLILSMGVNGLVMTRDLFNIFVFLEIVSISTFALITLEKNLKSLSAGFKYMLAGGVVSTFFLLGVIFVYYFSGNLNLDFINTGTFNNLGMIAVFMMSLGIFIELKPFPANGWALDVYEATDSGIVSVIAVVNSAAIFYVFYKIMPMIPNNLLQLLGYAGLLTFVLSSLMGLKQENAKRLLGYSSIGQMGLLISAVVFTTNAPEFISILIVGGFLVNHLLAKAGLFWITGIVKKEKIADWGVLNHSKPLLILFGLLLFALASLPPFPGFWAKWEFIRWLIMEKMTVVAVLVLIGSLCEIAFLFRWFNLAVKKEDLQESQIETSHSMNLPVAFLAGVLAVIPVIIMKYFYQIDLIHLAPVIALIVIFIIEIIPSKIKGILSLITLGTYGYYLYPLLSGLQLFFAVIFIIGGGIILISTFNRKGLNQNFYGLLLMMILSLGNLLIAKGYLEFFLNWEFMTISSYLLFLRGKNARNSSFVYLIFSIAGAYLLMLGFAFAPAVSSDMVLLKSITQIQLPLVSIILMSLGFLIKSGSLGVHIWVPDAYAEAEDDVTALIAGILSKVGILGFFVLAVSAISHKPDIDIFYWIGWIGVLSTIIGAFLAVFQEDMKRLLAYSSMSQIGYIVASVAMLSHLGLVTALYLSFNHLLFKGLIFLAIAGVIYRTKTRNMYEMGGLIKKMPISYISVLIGIIAVSGVPPLSGFGSKWLLYSAFIEKGWYLQSGVLFFASAVSFLYLYRLIHSVFLGQLKYEHQNVKEAPIWFILPQLIFIIALMTISTFPNLIIQPLNAIVGNYIDSSIVIDGYKVTSSLGYWNGNQVMMVTMGVFMVPLLLLLLLIGKTQKVKQFNIVFAAERPESPQTTHVAHNMYAHYKKVLGGWGKPRILSFWNGVAEWTHSLGNLFRQFYTGNGQTYILHIILYMVVLYIILGV